MPAAEIPLSSSCSTTLWFCLSLATVGQRLCEYSRSLARTPFSVYMYFNMRGLRHNFKIFRRIIPLVPILVMNNFSFY